MGELLAGLEWLSEQYSTVPSRLAVSLLALVMFSASSWVINRLRKRTDDETEIRAALVDLVASLAIAGGLLVLAAVLVGVWGGTGTVAFALAQVNIDASTLGRLLLTAGLFAGAFVAVRFIKRFINGLLGGHDVVSKHQLEITYRTIQVGIYLLAGLITLGFWRIDLSGLLIGAGVLGAVIGLAAQETLSSILAGFVLMFSRPFEIGDWIEIGEHEGIVTDITIVNTRIQTFDGEYVVIPNDEVSVRTITDRSRKGRLRLRVPIGVDYDTDLDHAEGVILEAITDLDPLMRVPRPHVIIREFGDSSIIFEARFWIDKPSSRRRWRAKRVVIKAINEAFDREGIKIPYPQRELSGRTETGGFRVRTEDRPTDAPEPTPHTDGGGNGNGAE